MKSSIHSSFWLGKSEIGTLKKASEVDPVQLAKYQKVISNFVRILTKQSIPVEYRSSGNSFTDSKKIVIGSNISYKNFDSVVGLALHEASHIKLTDFSVWYDYINTLSSNGISQKVVDQLRSNYHLQSEFKNIVNYIEDRRIDYYVYTNSPGYKDYYQSLYDRYFNSPYIDKGLASSEYRDGSLKSYMFRIANLTNPNSDLDALPNLREIYNLIFSNVRTLKSTTETLVLSAKVFELILQGQDEISENSESESDENSESSESGESSDNGEESKDEQTSDQESQQNSDSIQTEEGDNNGSGEGIGIDGDSGEKENQKSVSETDAPSELTNRQKEHLDKWIEKQRKFLNGDVQKRKVSKQVAETVSHMSKSNTEVVEVEFDTPWNGSNSSNNVVVLKGLNENTLNLMESTRYSYSYFKSFGKDTSGVTQMEENVLSGITLGKRLGRKLQIRNTDVTTLFNRQKKGKIEKRRLHALGTGDDTVFFNAQVESHTDAFIHLSIDASGSMTGTPFYNSIKSAVAVAQMASMTNIDVQVSLRYVDNFGGSASTQKEYPVMWIVYDSRVDKIQSIKKYFKYLSASGYTPEGLCFASIMKQLPTGSDALNTYFINYSDGLPGINNTYCGQVSLDHTKKEVDKLRKNGYTVLSFFIRSSYYSPDQLENSGVWKQFCSMYGSSARAINPVSITDLARELQKMFLKK